jgi:hypothetical protein
MIGRAPVQPFPGYAPSFPASPPAYGAPQAFLQQPSSQPAAWVPQPPAWPGQASALASHTDPHRPVFRGQMPEQPAEAPPPRPAPPPLAMPSPGQLGLGISRPGPEADVGSSVDWNAALKRARELGATGFNVARVPEGGFQVVLLLPTGEADRTQHIEATAASEAGALRLALERAELWATRPR